MHRKRCDSDTSCRQRITESTYSGLELQPQCADLARRSVKYNHLEDKVTIEEGDVCNASEIFGRESVEVVTVNPPYMIGQHGIKNADDAMTIARHEVKVYT